MRTLGVGLLGLGTVGSEVARRLEQESALLAERAGVPLALRRVALRDPHRARSVELPPGIVTTDPESVLADPGVQIVVELIGGESPPHELLLAAIAGGRHVVTANKLVIAKHGPELSHRAAQAGVGLLFEAAVGGGIPVIGPLVDSLSANRVRRVYGILNSTTNFILTRMGDGLAPAVAIAEAQRLGYAESDPSSDTEGFDAAYKISILASLAFGGHVDPNRVDRTGITGLTAEMITAAGAAGRNVKLVAEAVREGEWVSIRVRPVRVATDSALGNTRGSHNLIAFAGDMVTEVTMQGAGAGGPATASAVLADIIRMARSIVNGQPARIDMPARELPLAPPGSPWSGLEDFEA